MAPRASWKGFLKVGEVCCPVALHAATSTSDRIAFHTLNRRTGNRVQRVFVDSETGASVDRDDQVKGYAIEGGEHVVLKPHELASAVPDSDKTLSVTAFVGCGDIDTLYLDKPYYITPTDADATDAFVLIREGLRSKSVAALAQAVLFRRVRTVLIRAHGKGLIGTTLNFDHEVRSAEDVFEDLPDIPVAPEMLDLACHVIKTRRGRFDPRAFDDRYEAALADLVQAKLEGRRPEPRPRAEPGPEQAVDLMDALRESAARAARPPRRGADPKARSGSPAPTHDTRKAG